MKQWIFVLAVLLSGTGAAAQGILEVENKVLELANLKADDQPRTEVFAVKNTGDRPVIITRVSPMSYLLEAEWQREPLLPGRSGSIRVTFVPARLPERFDYKIMVYSNAAEKRTELRLKGNLVDNPEKPALLYHYTIDGMKFKKSNVNFGKVYTWETVKDTVRYLNTRQDAVTVGIAKDLPAHLSAEFVPARVEPGEGGMLVLTYDAKTKGDYGYCYESLPLEVNGKRDPRNRLTITATLAEDFSRLDKEELEHAPGVSFASRGKGGMPFHSHEQRRTPPVYPQSKSDVRMHCRHAGQGGAESRGIDGHPGGVRLHGKIRAAKQDGDCHHE